MAITQTMGVVNTWSIEKLQNRVSIYTDDGALVRNVEDSSSVGLNGVLSHVVVQKKGEDGESEAQAWLADHGLTPEIDGGGAGPSGGPDRRSGGGAEGHGERGDRPVLGGYGHPHLEERAALRKVYPEFSESDRIGGDGTWQSR